jgi:hypothetical protein
MGIEHTSKVCDAKEMGASLVDVAVNALESVFSISPGLVNVIVAVIGSAAEFVAEEPAAPEPDDDPPLDPPHAARPMEQATATARTVETLNDVSFTAISSGPNFPRA